MIHARSRVFVQVRRAASGVLTPYEWKFQVQEENAYQVGLSVWCLRDAGAKKHFQQVWHLETDNKYVRQCSFTVLTGTPIPTGTIKIIGDEVKNDNDRYTGVVKVASPLNKWKDKHLLRFLSLGQQQFFVTAYGSVVLSSLNNSQFSRNENLATQYATIGKEALRQIRDYWLIKRFGDIIVDLLSGNQWSPQRLSSWVMTTSPHIRTPTIPFFRTQ